MKTIIVTRHSGALEWLRRHHREYKNCEVIPHVGREDIEGKRVIGVLPVHLAALCQEYWHMSMNVPPEARGKDLSADEMEHSGCSIYRFYVEPLCPPIKNIKSDRLRASLIDLGDVGSPDDYYKNLWDIPMHNIYSLLRGEKTDYTVDESDLLKGVNLDLVEYKDYGWGEYADDSPFGTGTTIYCNIHSRSILPPSEALKIFRQMKKYKERKIKHLINDTIYHMFDDIDPLDIYYRDNGVVETYLYNLSSKKAKYSPYPKWGCKQHIQKRIIKDYNLDTYRSVCGKSEYVDISPILAIYRGIDHVYNKEENE